MKRKVSQVVFLTAILILLGSAHSLFASDDQIPYPVRIPYRIIRGAANIALGWTEIFLRPFGERKTESALESMSLGGTHALMRLAVGGMDITTFWVPDIQMLDLYPDWQGWPYLFHWS